MLHTFFCAKYFFFGEINTLLVMFHLCFIFRNTGNKKRGGGGGVGGGKFNVQKNKFFCGMPFYHPGRIKFHVDTSTFFSLLAHFLLFLVFRH